MLLAEVQVLVEVSTTEKEKAPSGPSPSLPERPGTWQSLSEQEPTNDEDSADAEPSSVPLGAPGQGVEEASETLPGQPDEPEWAGHASIESEEAPGPAEAIWAGTRDADETLQRPLEVFGHPELEEESPGPPASRLDSFQMDLSDTEDVPNTEVRVPVSPLSDEAYEGYGVYSSMVRFSDPGSHSRESLPALLDHSANPHQPPSEGSSSVNLKSKFKSSRMTTKSLGSLDIRRNVSSPVQGSSSRGPGLNMQSARAVRDLIPSAEMARRSLTINSGSVSPVSKDAPELPRGSSLKQLRPVTSIRPPRSRPVSWVDRKQHVSEVRTAQMDLGWDMEGHLPDLSSAAPGFLSQAHLRSEEYWKDLLGIDDESIATFSFIQSDLCGKFMATCIIVFVLVVGHHDTDRLPNWGSELVHFILAISLIEIAMHICNHYQGAPYKKPEDKTILFLDTIAVLVSCCEIWIFPVVLGPSLHFSRMVWLIRFLRVISMIPSLRELTLGVLDALQGLFWVLMFLFIFVYALAVVLTRMIGHHERSSDPDIQEVQDMFANVGNSMFYLFQLTSQWSLVPLFPLLKASPATCVGFTLFYIYSGWVIVAVMTGTVSFTMISFKARMVQEDELREEEKRVFVKQVLEDIFLALDEDGNGELSYEEFQALLRSKEVLLLLSDNTDIKIQDLEDMWQWIDTDKSGSVTIVEFFEGFEMLNEPFRQKTLLKVQERISGEIQITSKRLLELAMESLDACCHSIYTPMNKIHAVLEQVQIQLLTALRLKHQVGLVPVNAQTDEDTAVAEVLVGAGLQVPEVANSLASLEARLEMQMLEAIERINNFRAVKTQRHLRWSQSSHDQF